MRSIDCIQNLCYIGDSHSRVSLKIELLINVQVILYTGILDFFLENYLFEGERYRLILNRSTLDRTCHFYKKLRIVNIKTLIIRGCVK